MQPKSDAQLLRDFAQGGAEAAFSELVRRHTNLVYSAALRQVESSAVAAEIAQNVFIGLACGAQSLAPKLAADGSLAGWLCRSARNLSLNHRRDEFRRHIRERHAMEQLVSISDEAPDWEHLRRVLDDAMAELSETDYDALVLRFFQNQSLRAVGAAIGVSDDTAQKRVSRALEKLRELLSQRGVRTGAAALSVAISANAVQSAPIGMVVTISSAALAGTAVSTSAVITATKTVAMTTLQKTIIGTAFIAAVGTGIFEAHQASKLREQNRALQQQQTSLAAQIRLLQTQRDEANRQLALMSARPAPRLPAPPIQPAAPQKEDWQATNLYTRLKDMPVKLTRDQVDSYLKANGRDAASLLAAFRTSGDTNLLKEAMEKYPDNPQVAFEAALSKDLSPAEQRQWLDAFKKSAPDNALANYLSALNYFTAGQIDQGVQELSAASGKPFQDYTLSRIQDDEEAYLAAGHSLIDARALASSQLLLPQLAQMKSLSEDMTDLANAYHLAGDETSAQSVRQFAVNLGQRYSYSSAGLPEISQLVGMAVERNALRNMDPNSSLGNGGQTVQERLDQLTQEHATLIKLNDMAEPLLPTLSDQDWMIYKDRWIMFGEEDALRWVVDKYGTK